MAEAGPRCTVSLNVVRRSEQQEAKAGSQPPRSRYSSVVAKSRMPRKRKPAAEAERREAEGKEAVGQSEVCGGGGSSERVTREW